MNINYAAAPSMNMMCGLNGVTNLMKYGVTCVRYDAMVVWEWSAAAHKIAYQYQHYNKLSCSRQQINR